MITEVELATLEALFRRVVREEIERCSVKKKPPEDITKKRRAAAQVMLAKRAARAALAEQNAITAKLNGHKHPRANAEQKCIGEGNLICICNGLKGPVEVRQSYVMELISAYPGVMVAQEIERARIWLDDNPTKRKANIRKYLTGWVRRKQG